MKKHDPLCIALYPELISPIICTYCQLIKKVREEYETPEIEGVPF
jgi:hypothetical protein